MRGGGAYLVVLICVVKGFVLKLPKWGIMSV